MQEMHSEETVRKIFRLWIEEGALVANQPLQPDDNGSFLRPVLGRKAAQGERKERPRSTAKMNETMRAFYNSDS